MPGAPGPADAPPRRGTSTFGVGTREGHDASAFYARFRSSELSDDHQVNPPEALDEIWVGDSSDLHAHGDTADGSVALAVTSPPVTMAARVRAWVVPGQAVDAVVERGDPGAVEALRALHG